MAISPYITTTLSACASSIPAAILTGASVIAARTPQGSQALGKLGVNYFTLGVHNLYKIAAAGFLTSLSIKIISNGLDSKILKKSILEKRNWQPAVKNIVAGLISAAVFVRLNSNCKDWKSVNTIIGGAAFFAIQKLSDSITNTTVKVSNKAWEVTSNKYSKVKDSITEYFKKDKNSNIKNDLKSETNVVGNVSGNDSDNDSDND